MKQGTTALAAMAIVLAGTTALNAQPLPPLDGGPVYASRAYYGGPPVVYAPEDLAMPSYEVAGILRSRGFLPLGGPVRRGRFYVVSAVHPRGGDGRVVIDAYTGQVVRFTPTSEIRARSDEMVLVYQGPTFPPPNGLRSGPPPATMQGAPRPPASVPRVANREPSSAPLVTPRPRPQSAPQRPETAQAPPVPAPVETKPAAASPPLVPKPVEKAPTMQPTQPLPPVQTLE